MLHVLSLLISGLVLSSPTWADTGAVANFRSERCRVALSEKQTDSIDNAILEEMIAEYKATEDSKLRNRILMSFYRLSGKFARELCGNFGEDFVDNCLKEGLFGVVDAIKRFDPTAGKSFRTYAPYWIRKRIIEWRLSNYSAVDIPRYADADTARRRINSLLAKNGGDNTSTCALEGACAELDIPRNILEVILFQNAAQNATSTSVRHSTVKSEVEYELEFQSDTLGPDEITEITELRKRLVWILEQYAREYIDIAKNVEMKRDLLFEHIYPIRVVEPTSLEELAQRHGLTERRAKQIKDKLIVHFRKTPYPALIQAAVGESPSEL